MSRPSEPTAPAPPRADRLRGVIEGITYQHPETRYTVLRVALEAECEAPGELFSSRTRGPRVVHAVGKAGEIALGERVSLAGEWKTHPKHGAQFHFQVLQNLPPVGPEGVARYLAS